MKKVKLLALVSAVITALLLYAFLNTMGRSKEEDTVRVLTAMADIPANTLITTEMLKVTDLPPKTVLADAALETSAVVGKVSKVQIYKGEQILNAKLISAGDTGNNTLAYAITPNMRAITIAVDATSGLSNMIVPGNHVDIIGEFTTEGKTAASGTQKNSYTVLVLENIKVLATDNVLSETGKQETKKDSEPSAYATITLEVTPDQAMKLSMAQHEGTLRAVLRSPLDEKKTNLPNITLNNVLNK